MRRVQRRESTAQRRHGGSRVVRIRRGIPMRPSYAHAQRSPVGHADTCGEPAASNGTTRAIRCGEMRAASPREARRAKRWTGQAGRFSPTGLPPHWKPRTLLRRRRWRFVCPLRAAGPSEYRSGQSVHGARVHRRRAGPTALVIGGRQRGLARQRVRRADLAQHQVRRSPFESVRVGRTRPVLHREYINLYNRKRPIRAWRTRRRTRHASRRCLRSNRQHDCVGRST